MDCPVEKHPAPVGQSEPVDATHSEDGKLFSVSEPMYIGQNFACAKCITAWHAGQGGEVKFPADPEITSRSYFPEHAVAPVVGSTTPASVNVPVAPVPHAQAAPKKKR